MKEVDTYAPSPDPAHHSTFQAEHYGIRVFRVTATDNGEPGGHDAFRLELDNGYVTQGTLLSGNVELLIGNLSSTPLAGFTCGAP